MDIKTTTKVLLGVFLTLQVLLVILEFVQCHLCHYCWHLVSLFLLLVGYFTIWKEDFLVTITFAIAELVSVVLAVLLFSEFWLAIRSGAIVAASIGLAAVLYREQKRRLNRVDQIL
ncbi:hypothetical protein TYRP_003840 [Tyrophagus putrescentiae]|nr:hypothetical protein TYRP_003840 [Tyrophagus putrescentiae]